MRDRARELAVEVNGVHEKPVVLGAAFEPLAGVDVFRAFSDVDVDAHTELGREGADGVERVVREREARMCADIAAAACLKIAFVLFEARFRFLEAVAGRHFVARRQAHAGFGAGIRDHG